MLDKLYIELQNKLTTNISAIKHFSLWNGQTKDQSQHLSFKRPAIFLEITEGIPERVGRKHYNFPMRFTLHVASDFTGTLRNASSQQQQDRALSHLNLLTSIIKELDAWSNENAELTGTTWSDLAFDSDFDNIIEHILVFDCTITFNMNKSNYVVLDPRPTIDLQPEITSGNE